jgi:hypothetical protein
VNTPHTNPAGSVVEGDLRLRRAKRIAVHALRHGVPGSPRLTGTAIRDARTVSELLDLFPLVHKAEVAERSATLSGSTPRGPELVLRTSGSSGGVVEVPWRPEDLVASRRAYARTVARARFEAGLEPTPRRPLLAMGASPFHVSAAIYRLAVPPTDAASSRIGMDSDVATVVARVVAAAPDHLTTYPSVANRLIRHPSTRFPASVALGGEHASVALKEAIEARGALVVDTYGCTEVGLIAVGVGSSGPLVILGDDVVVERVGASASRPGYERIALTSLHNVAFPILRYVIDDEVRVASCAPDALVTALSDVLPGSDPPLVKIADLDISSRWLRGALDSVLPRGRYRVSIRADGVEVTLDREGHHVADEVRTSVGRILATLGVADPHVLVRVVDTIAGGKAARRIVVEGA